MAPGVPDSGLLTLLSHALEITLALPLASRTRPGQLYGAEFQRPAAATVTASAVALAVTAFGSGRGPARPGRMRRANRGGGQPSERWWPYRPGRQHGQPSVYDDAEVARPSGAGQARSQGGQPAPRTPAVLGRIGRRVGPVGRCRQRH